MAVFEIWDVRGRLDHPIDYAVNEEKTDTEKYSDEQLGGLQDVINYATNNKKTSPQDKQLLVDGINCNYENARQTMAATKKIFNDQKEIIAFHGFQSFAPGEVDAYTAHEIGVRFATKMWGDRFEVVVATHLNTNCFHNHFVINSTSFVDGKRFYDNKEHLRKARAESDKFCREYQLSVIEEPSKIAIPYPLYKAEQAGMPSTYNLLRADIDEAIEHSFTTADFEKIMKEKGYQLNWNENNKYATVQAPHREKSIRLRGSTLGEEYTRECVLARIKSNDIFVRHKGYEEPIIYKGYRRITAHSILIAKKKGGLKGLYLHYCYLLGILPKGTQRNNTRVHYIFKDELLKLDRLSAQTKLLNVHNISTVQELSLHIDSLEAKMSTIKKERQRLWNQSRTITNPDELQKLKGKISECSNDLKELRKEVSLCEDIKKRSTIIEEKVNEYEQSQEELSQERKEGIKDEQRRRCSRASR